MQQNNQSGRCEKCNEFHGVLIKCEDGETGLSDEEIRELLNDADNA